MWYVYKCHRFYSYVESWFKWKGNELISDRNQLLVDRKGLSARRQFNVL
jgi:hypothetical protein